ncbi:hypothetical protein SMA90_27430, partial [Escherichia coli]
LNHLCPIIFTLQVKFLYVLNSHKTVNRFHQGYILGLQKGFYYLCAFTKCQDQDGVQFYRN